MSAEIQIFSAPLLLLLHLHLLNYPFDSQNPLDEHTFDSNVYSASSRSKSMEDISFFLVSKIEGQRGIAKKILPTYPCLQHSDAISFRTSLSKYIETIRHAAIQDAHGSSWWKDVVVRRSILDECAGERHVTP
jgi:hypothetical protein